MEEMINKDTFAEADGYPSRDGNEDRTLYSLRKRGLVHKPDGSGRWWLTDQGTEVIYAWDTAGSL